VITPASIVCWRGEPLAANLGGRVVLMKAERGNYYELDEVGTDVWERLARPIRVGDLCASLHERYEGDETVIERDVLALLEQLVGEDLIDVRES
jgi:hypothetical protein